MYVADSDLLAMRQYLLKQAAGWYRFTSPIFIYFSSKVVYLLFTQVSVVSKVESMLVVLD